MDEAEEPAEAVASADEPSPDGAGDSAAAEVGVAPRKKTRRGTRGGRKRRKPQATGEAVEIEDDARDETASAAVEAASSSDGSEAPAEYVPMSEWIEDFDARTSSGRR